MSVGLYDFIMVASHNTSYLVERYSQEGVNYFTNYPLGLLILFGINVIGVMLALIVAFWSRRYAAYLALTSAIADVLLLIITIVFLHRFEIIGPALTLQDIAICAVIFGLAGYFWWLHKRESKQTA